MAHYLLCPWINTQASIQCYSEIVLMSVCMSVRAHHNTKFLQPTCCLSSLAFYSLNIPWWCDPVVYNSHIQSCKPIAICAYCICLTLTFKLILPSVYTCIRYTLDGEYMNISM